MTHEPAHQRSSAPVVIITGASAGVGRATALAFARRGWRVGLIARDHDGLAAAVREIATLGGHAAMRMADVADAEALEEAAAALETELGACDVWVNNAM